MNDVKHINGFITHQLTILAINNNNPLHHHPHCPHRPHRQAAIDALCAEAKDQRDFGAATHRHGHHLMQMTNGALGRTGAGAGAGGNPFADTFVSGGPAGMLDDDELDAQLQSLVECDLLACQKELLQLEAEVRESVSEGVNEEGVRNRVGR